MTTRFVWIASLAVALAAPGLAQSAGSADQALADCRRRIDAVDARIVALLSERAKIVQEVGRIKQQMRAPVAAPKRVDEVLRKVAARNPGPLPNEAVERIYRQIIQEMTDFERAEIQRGSNK
ncbi:MAG TPA: chorismate mutase [Bryobacterales bacterium]|nr:chorismate mutase [Bryobacterales bacterium]